MDYHAAFIKLYGAAGAALEQLYTAKIETQEHSRAMEILREAIAEAEELP